jgi:hypothetical protein
MIAVVNVIVRKGKAYTCVAAQTEAGFYVDSEPVFVVDLDTDEVLAALERVIALGHPSVPTPTVEEMGKRPGLVPSAAGVSNWKKLAQGGTSCSIQWRKDGTITLFISRLDKKGRFEWDPARTRTFAGDTPLLTVVEVMLEDVRSRHEVTEQ